MKQMEAEQSKRDTYMLKQGIDEDESENESNETQEITKHRINRQSVKGTGPPKHKRYKDEVKSVYSHSEF